MPNQKDVARLAGVSFITVSRVINGQDNVAPETRKKVEDAIEELGYTPSFAGKALNSGRSRTIGLMSNESFNSGFESSFLVNCLKGIEHSCSQNDYDILFSPSYSYNDPLRPYRQKKADGILYLGLQSMPMEFQQEIQTHRIPCVVIGDRPEHPDISWIDSDNETAAYRASCEALSRGHKKICFMSVIPEISNRNITDRERGVRKADPEADIIRGSFDYNNNRKLIRAYLQKNKQPPSVIFCATDAMALSVYAELRSLGYSIPYDISLIGFDGVLDKNPYFPRITSNVQDFAVIGQQAANLLIQEIESGKIEKHEIILPVLWSEGQTLRSL